MMRPNKLYGVLCVWPDFQAAAALLAAQDSSSDDVPLAGVMHSSAAGKQAAAAEEASPTKQVLVSTVSDTQPRHLFSSVSHTMARVVLLP